MNTIIKIHNVFGNDLTMPINKHQFTDTYEFDFNPSSLSSGTYFYKLQAGSFVETKKMILIR